MKASPFILLLLFAVSSLFSQKPELIIPIGHTDHVYAIAISPDGSWMVTGGKDNYLILWNREGEILKKIPGHSGYIQSVAISPDGEKILACAGKDAILWSKEGEQLVSFEDPDNELQRLRTVAFSPTGDTILLGREDVYNVALYEQDGTFLRRVETKKPDPPIMSAMLEMSGVLAATFSPSGRYVLIGNRSYPGVVNLVEGKVKQIQTGGPNVHLWDLETNSTKKFFTHSAEVYAVDFSLDGKYFATGGKDSVCIVSDLDGEVVDSKKLEGVINSVSFSNDGKKVVMGGKGVQLWNRENGEVLQLSSPTMGTYIYEVGFSPDGEQIYASCNDDIIHFWDFEGNLIKTIKSSGSPNCVGRFTKDGKGIYSGASLGLKWDFVTNQVQKINGQNNRIYKMAFSYDEQTVASSRADTVSLRDFEGHLLWERVPDKSTIYEVAISATGERVLITTDNALAELRDRSDTLICKVTLPHSKNQQNHRKNHIYSGAISPDGKQFLISDWIEDAAHLYNDQGKRLGTYKVAGKYNVMESMAFSSNGSMMVLGERKGRVTLLRKNGQKYVPLHLTPYGWLTLPFPGTIVC